MRTNPAYRNFLIRRFERPKRIATQFGPRIWFGVDCPAKQSADSAQPTRGVVRATPAAPRQSQPGTILAALRPLANAGFSLWLLGVGALPIGAQVLEVGPIGLTVHSLRTELPFYTNTLSFELESIRDDRGRLVDALLGLEGIHVRTATLKLGSERITLTEHQGRKGRPIPQDSRSNDRWFQHIAIVVSDMDQAYARLLQSKVTHVSTAPQTLPDWNPDAGGIKAFYFRDPEDHVLEIIWFPPGKGNPKWQHPAGDVPEAGVGEARSRTGSRALYLGIDHTAIVVSDTDQSLAFYRDQLGLKVAGGAHNYGPEQEHLNQVFGARLRITALKAARGPGIEFLEYIAPPGGRDLPADARANDLVFWNTQLRISDLPTLATQLAAGGVRSVSRSGKSTRAWIVRDPDGHALQLNAVSEFATQDLANH